MNARAPRLRPALLLGLTLLSARLFAQHDHCDIRSADRRKEEWQYPVPERALLPSADALRQKGALVILDETRWEARDPRLCTYTRVVLLGNQAAIDEFGTQTIFLFKGDRPLIKARVQSPDGSVYELRDEDLSCTDARDRKFLFFSRKAAPVRILINYPKLVSGAVIQQQVTVGCRFFGETDLDELSAPDGTFMIDLRRGGSRMLDMGLDPDRSEWEGTMIRYVMLKPLHRISSAWRAVPLERPLKFTERTTSDPNLHWMAFTATRPATPPGMFIPSQERDATYLAYGFSGEGFRSFQDWKQLVAAAYPREPADRKALKKLLQLRPDWDALPALEFARRAHALYRDAQAGREPPGTLYGVLSARGLDVRLVAARHRDTPDIDRGLVSMSWFHHELMALELAGERTYFTVHGKHRFGAIPSELQGGEALVIRSPSVWEHATLPVQAGENRLETRLEVAGFTAGALSGRIRMRFSGRPAESLREELPDAPERRARQIRDYLGQEARANILFTNLHDEAVADADRSPLLEADFELPGGAHPLGGRYRVPLVLWRGGPAMNEFLADQRAQPVVFGQSKTFLSETVYPAAWFTGAALPEPVVIRGPGVDYRLTVARDGEQLVAKRELTRRGAVEPAKYAELRAAFTRIAQADESALSIPPPAAAPPAPASAPAVVAAPEPGAPAPATMPGSVPASAPANDQ